MIKWNNVYVLVGFPDSSVGKESTCNAGNSSCDSWVGKIPWRRDRLPTPVFLDFPCGSVGKESACKQETWVQSLGWEDTMEKWKVTYCIILFWRIPWTVQFMGSQRVGHDWPTFTFTFHMLAGTSVQFSLSVVSNSFWQKHSSWLMMIPII